MSLFYSVSFTLTNNGVLYPYWLDTAETKVSLTTGIRDINKYLDCLIQKMTDWDKKNPEPSVSPPCSYPNPQTSTSNSSRDNQCDIWAARRKIAAGVYSAQCGKYFDMYDPKERFPPFPLPNQKPPTFPV